MFDILRVRGGKSLNILTHLPTCPGLQPGALPPHPELTRVMGHLFHEVPPLCSFQQDIFIQRGDT